MTTRHFRYHDEVVALHGVLTAAWAKAEPNHNVTLYPAGYSETFLDMARAVTAAGFHLVPVGGDASTEYLRGLNAAHTAVENALPSNFGQESEMWAYEMGFTSAVSSMTDTIDALRSDAVAALNATPEPFPPHPYQHVLDAFDDAERDGVTLVVRIGKGRTDYWLDSIDGDMCVLMTPGGQREVRLHRVTLVNKGTRPVAVADTDVRDGDNAGQEVTR